MGTYEISDAQLRAGKRRSWARFIGLVVVVTLVALPIITYPLGRDQGEFATIGRGILDGKIPYVDLWNPKPPAVFYVYAAAIRLFGRTAEAIRVLDLILYPLLAAVLWRIGSRIGNGRVGMWAALLLGVFYFSETFWTLTQNDGIVLLPMALAVLCAIHANDANMRRSRLPLWALASGALCGWVFWFKYNFAIFAIVPVCTYLWIRHITPRVPAPPTERRFPSPLRDALAFAAGGLLVVISGAGYMASIGALDALVESARVTASYTAQGIGDIGEAVSIAVGYRWQHWGALLVMALFGLVYLWRFARRSMSWGIIIPWLLAGTAVMAVQLKFYDYHFLPMLPPLVLLGAFGIEWLIEIVIRTSRIKTTPNPSRLRWIIGSIGVVVLATVIWSRTLPYLTGREDQAAYYGHFVAGEFVADESLQVATFLRQRVSPGDSLFIWGFRPEVYYLSQLNPAVRFIFQFPLVADWYPPEWRDQTAEILWAALPPYVLVLQVDYMPWVTGSEEDSNTLLQGYTELNNWLEYNYVRDSQIGNFFIWRRTSLPPSSS